MIIADVTMACAYLTYLPGQSASQLREQMEI